MKKPSSLTHILPTLPPLEVGDFNPLVSITDDAFAKPSRTLRVVDIIDWLRTGTHRQQVAKIREKFATVLIETGDIKAAKKAVDADKKHLPGIMFSGVFHARGDENLDTYSQILCGDADGLDASLISVLFDQITGDPHCCTGSISPSGFGIKFLCRTTGTAGQHERSVAAMVKYFRETHGIKLDPSCKNLERLCFAPDNASNWNLAAIAFAPMAEERRTVCAAQVAQPPTRIAIAERILGVIKWTDASTGLCKCPGEHLHTTTTEANHCRVKLDGAPTVFCFHGSCGGIKDGVNHELRSQIGKAEFVKPVFPAGLTAARLRASPDIIILPSGAVSISDCASVIFQRIAPMQSLFWRGGILVELVEMDGVQSLAILRPEKFRSDVEKIGQLHAYRAAGTGELALKPAKMSSDDAKAILAASESRKFLPSIASVLRCPVLIESKSTGVAILGKGYHAELGGLLIVDSDTPPHVGLKEAVASLRRLVEEFHFQTEADRSRALAAFLTPALRMGGHIRDNIPIDCAEADKSQSGKGYRHEMVWTLYNEKAYLVTDKTGGVGSVDESFAAALVSARPFISLDNFRGRMDSRKLESFLTCSTLFPARVPGKQEAMIDPKKFILQISSNGLESTEDFANRASICRIQKRPGFQYRDTLGELQRRQPYFLGCVFAIITEWVARGKQRSQDTRHDFREWSQALDWIMQNILGCAPLMDGHQAAQKRTSNPALVFMRLVAIAVAAENRLGVPLIASELVDVCELHSIQIPGKPSNKETASRQFGCLCKQVFREGDTVGVDGFTITVSSKAYRKRSGDMDTKNAYAFTNASMSALRCEAAK